MILNKRQIKKIFLSWQKECPEPTTELIYNSPFELLLAVILSAQATDKSVNKATEKLFAIAKTPEEILKLGEEKLSTYIKSIGLYRTKAKNIILTCKIICEDYNGQIPTERKLLEQLPGVGRKTANVILNTIFKQPVIAVDTHIFRIANRIGLAKGKNVREVEEQLLKNIPDEFLINAHHWLILHGRYVCRAQKPKCQACIISDICINTEFR